MNAALAESVSWEDLAELVVMQGRAGHPVASRIIKLQLAENRITLRLDSEVDSEVEKETEEEEAETEEEEEKEEEVKAKKRKKKKGKNKARGKKTKAQAPYVDVAIDLAISAFANSSTCVSSIVSLFPSPACRLSFRTTSQLRAQHVSLTPRADALSLHRCEH